MKYIFSVAIVVFLNLAAIAQSSIFDQKIQYNILIDNPIDSALVVRYEVLVQSDTDEDEQYITASLDSFLMILNNDLSYQPSDKNQLLFYIHGMWGGRQVNFNKSYDLLSKAYIGHELSDIARILSIKWPCNKLEYKKNKKVLYSISDSISNVMLSFLVAYNNFTTISTKKKSIDIIAHSLGTELFKEFVRYASEYDRLNSYFDQIIIAAPDWDVDAFEIDSSLYNIQHMGERAHIYFSTRDMTLSISKNLNKQGRFGLDGPNENLILPTNVYTVDVTNIKDNKNLSDLMSGHNYYRSSPSITEDILFSMLGYNSDSLVNRQKIEKYDNVYQLRIDRSTK